MPDQRCRRPEAWLAALVWRRHHPPMCHCLRRRGPLPDVAGQALQTNKDLTNTDLINKERTPHENPDHDPHLGRVRNTP